MRDDISDWRPCLSTIGRVRRKTKPVSTHVPNATNSAHISTRSASIESPAWTRISMHRHPLTHLQLSLSLSSSLLLFLSLFVLSDYARLETTKLFAQTFFYFLVRPQPSHRHAHSSSYSLLQNPPVRPVASSSLFLAR